MNGVLTGGFAWRCWRVGTRAGAPRLRNPWTSSGTYWWEPGKVENARCFWPDGVSPLVDRCQGYMSEDCSCGIRGMDTVSNLAAFFHCQHNLIGRDPHKADVVGRIQLGGRVHRTFPDGDVMVGYRRAEFARIVGPLYVSPLMGGHYEALAAAYGPVEVLPPSAVPSGSEGQQGWLDSLAAHLEGSDARARAAVDHPMRNWYRFAMFGGGA